MSKFKIIIDSTSDLSKHFIEMINPEIVALNVQLGDKTYQDGIELNPELLYEIMNQTGNIPKTSAPSPGIFLELFKKIKADGYKEALFIPIGASFSSTIQSAIIAAEEIEGLKVRIIDSLTLSSGSGLLAVRAHELRESGKSLDEVADYLLTITTKVRAQFIVDNLKMLNAGGRVTGIKFFLGQILRAHPFLQINDAKLEVVDTPKGKTERALDKMLDSSIAEIKAGLESPLIFITHTRGGDRIDYLINKLVKHVPRDNIFITEAGSVISSHCGPGTIGILYIRK